MQGRQMELGVPRTTEEDLRRATQDEESWNDDDATASATEESADDSSGLEILRRNPMMSHLLGALQRGESVGHYGRLVFAMVAHHFVSDATLISFLERDPSFGRKQAEAMARQVRERDYNPPRPERIAEWQRAQSFPICPEGDARKCNVYRDLRFPEDVYEHIEEFWEEGAERMDEEDRRR
jgi:hypothetical protein